VKAAYQAVDIDILWEKYEENEKGINRKTRKVLAESPQTYFGPLM
jgi:GDP-D-mannose dehydratase